MRLKAFLKKSGMSEAEFAVAIGRHKVSVCRYVTGVRRPDAETMRLIRDVTGGMVSERDFPRKPKGKGC